MTSKDLAYIDIEHNNLKNDIAQNIGRAIQSFFLEKQVSLFEEITEALANKSREDIITLFKAKLEAGAMSFLGREELKKILKLLSAIDYKKLDALYRKEHLRQLLFLGAKAGEYSFLYYYANEYLIEYGELEDEEFCLQLILTKANGAAQQKKKELAHTLYKQVLTKCKEMDSTYAWAYRGIALLLGEDDPEAINHQRIAADAFLISGNKQEYITSMVSVSKATINTDPQEALKILEQVIDISNQSEESHKLTVPGLLHLKARMLNRIDNQEDALKEAKKAADIRIKDNVHGLEVEAISSINAVLLFGKTMDSNLIEYYRNKKVDLETRIDHDKNQDYKIRKIIGEGIDQSFEELEKIKRTVDDQGDLLSRAMFYILLALKATTYAIDKRIELLESANLLLESEKEDDEVWNTLFSAFAYVYRDNSDYEKALFWFRKSYEKDPYNYYNRQEYVNLLWKQKAWEEALQFFKKERARFGDTVDILFGYGRSLLELDKPDEALKFFSKALKVEPTSEVIRKYLDEALEKSQFEYPLEKIISASEFKKQATIITINKCFDEFVSLIQQDMRMSFWKRLDDGKKQWVSCPEGHAQKLLHTFLKAQFGDSVDVFQEINSGAGRVDIFIRFNNGFRTILELKMCGNGYSSKYAQAGLDQLVHYLDNKSISLGYLIIFDGRSKEFGQDFKTIYNERNCTIFCKNIDVRYTVK